MKKLAIILVFAATLITGCISDKSEAPEQAASEQNNTDTAAPEEVADEKKGFRVEKLNAEDLSKGIFTGLEFQFGSKFQDIVSLWGDPSEKGNLRGGHYYLYQKNDYDLYLFDPKAGETVNHIQLNPKYPLHLDDIRKQLGTPDVDELDDMLHGTWILLYNYDNFSLFVVGKTEDRNSEILYLFLKNEQ